MARAFYAGMGQAVAERTILRKQESGDWEKWEDVARRVALGNSLLCPNKTDQPSEFETLHRHIANATILMSGRHLQHGDEDQPNRQMELFSNCSTSANSFGLFYLLMSGSGVGRSYDDDMMLVNWDNAPTVRCVLDEHHPDFDYSAHESLRDAKHKYGSNKEVMWFTVPDSREGWAKALEIWENAAFEKIHKDKMLILNFTDVRCKGTPIKGMQGRPASGPVPLMNAFHKANTLKGAGLARWMQAMYLDHYFAECVLVGGARRAARMSVKFWKDKSVLDFIVVKRPIEFLNMGVEAISKMRKESTHTPLGFLWSSNNSILVDKEFWQLLDTASDAEEYKSEDAVHARAVFSLASRAAYGDGTGEPGFINVDKLVCNDKGLEKLAKLKTGYIGSKKYQIEEDTEVYLSRLLRKAMKKTYYMIVNPCGEENIALFGAFCVIADLVPFHADTLDAAEEAARATTRALIRVNLMDSIYKPEVQRTNRIGVGLTGIHEFAWKFFGYGFRDLIDEKKSLPFWHAISRLKRAVQDEAERYSTYLGVECPHTDSTIKPAGTTSKLFGLTEGWHLPAMAQYLRWVQFRSDDPLVTQYADAGYPTKTLNTYKNVTIVGFPTTPVLAELGLGDKLVTAGEATPAEQYKWLALGEKYWLRGVDEAGEPLPKDTGSQISYCLAGNKSHLILTDSGLHRIESLSIPSSLPDRFGARQRAIDVVHNGIHPTLKLRLKNGAEIVATVDHKILVLNHQLKFEWKKIGDIVQGERVVRRVGDNLWSRQVQSLPLISHRRSDGKKGNLAQIVVPNIVTPTFGLWLGMLMADGHVGENSVGLTSADKEVATLFSTLCNELFSCKVHTSGDSRSSNIIRTNMHSRLLSRWLLQIGVPKYHDDNCIPDIILRSPQDVIKKFIKGYTLDGHVSFSTGATAHICSTVSKAMSNDLATLLWNLGYDAYISHKDARHYISPYGEGEGKEQFVVYLNKIDSLHFVKDIGFVEERKNEAVVEACRVKAAGVPHKSDAISREGINQLAEKDEVSFRGIHSHHNATAVSVGLVQDMFADVECSELAFLNDFCLRFTEVASIEMGKAVDTFDVSVDVSHEYVANSVVVHNTLKYDPDLVSYKSFANTLMKYQSAVKCCSIMPQEKISSYEYLPEEPVTKAQYEAISRNIKGRMEEDVDKSHIDCPSGACPIDFNKDTIEIKETPHDDHASQYAPAAIVAVPA